MDYIIGYHKFGKETQREIAVRAALEIIQSAVSASNSNSGALQIGKGISAIEKQLNAMADSIQAALDK